MTNPWTNYVRLNTPLPLWAGPFLSYNLVVFACSLQNPSLLFSFPLRNCQIGVSRFPVAILLPPIFTFCFTIDRSAEQTLYTKPTLPPSLSILANKALLFDFFS